MKRRLLPEMPIPYVAFVGALLTGAIGCSAAIGDACGNSLDCSAAGTTDLICDTRQLEGYCTVQGCSAGSCPDEAVCVAFYPTSYLTVACDPTTEDAVGVEVTTDDCGRGEACLSSGFCAAAELERRFCMKPCEADGDCRSGYACRTTGTRGAESVLDSDDPGRREFRFCVQGH